MKARYFSGLAIVIGAAVMAFSISSPRRPTAIPRDVASAMPEEEALSDVQKILNRRCVVCHSCNNAPCQLNLTSFEGVRRGLSQLQVYQPERLKSIAPSRLGIDAKSEEDWRRRGFHPVVDDRDPRFGLLLQSIEQRFSAKTRAADPAQVLESVTCPISSGALNEMYRTRPRAGMPYGLPALEDTEMRTLSTWLLQGAPALKEPQRPMPPLERQTLHEWEAFLNGTDPRQKLVSRYMFEHLFLAHIHFEANTKSFYRLVRSSTACADGPNEIPTRRPNDDPKANFFYCFQPFRGTIVEKTHLPYLMNAEKLEWTKKNFFGTDWAAGPLPSYDEKMSANPFITFEALPIEARYRFLLEDALYHVGTFIKGPVCNGNGAVNSIDEQFYVFFFDPKADFMVRDAAFRKVGKELLVLPFENGSDDKILDLVGHLQKYPPVRNRYRRIRQATLEKNFPQGLSLNELWSGDGKNDNALLTVVRHDDNAYVLKGARGDASPTAFVLDYALFERLVYNLSVGFDVYGNLPHQLSTRVYMGMIRMEGENNYLDFFPPEYRQPLRKDWYSSRMLGRLEKALIDVQIRDDHPSRVEIPAGLTPAQARAEMDRKILTERLLPWAQRRPDPINWKQMSFEESWGIDLRGDSVQRALAPLAALPASLAPWVPRFPDVSLVALRDDRGRVSRLFTVARNKRANTVGSLLFESQLRTPETDTLQIFEGLAASYPNYFFVVDEKQIDEFVSSIRKATTPAAWKIVRSKFGVDRDRVDFWSLSDQIQSYAQRSMGPEAGVIDYTHYDIWSP